MDFGVSHGDGNFGREVKWDGMVDELGGEADDPLAKLGLEGGMG